VQPVGLRVSDENAGIPLGFPSSSGAGEPGRFVTLAVFIGETATQASVTTYVAVSESDPEPANNTVTLGL
jgi:hypothetical protein